MKPAAQRAPKGRAEFILYERKEEIITDDLVNDCARCTDGFVDEGIHFMCEPKFVG